jgi:hypothetical protein
MLTSHTHTHTHTHMYTWQWTHKHINKPHTCTKRHGIEQSWLNFLNPSGKNDLALTIRCHHWNNGPWIVGVEWWIEPKSQLWNLIQHLLRFLLLPFIKACIIWESIQIIKHLKIYSHKGAFIASKRSQSNCQI